MNLLCIRLFFSTPVGGSSLRFETGLELFLRQCVYSGVVHVRARFMIFLMDYYMCIYTQRNLQENERIF
jgi:hypothetical protein